MEVKIGGTYMDREGDKVGPLIKPILSSYVARFEFDDGSDLHYNKDGSVYGKYELSNLDLVSEYPIGKTLTELDVKPGDVVRDTTGVFTKYVDFTCKEIIADMPYKGLRTLDNSEYGEGFFGDSYGLWVIISRDSQPTAKPKRMHPDDVARAITEYALDCGYAVEVKLINGSGTHIYEI